MELKLLRILALKKFLEELIIKLDKKRIINKLYGESYLNKQPLIFLELQNKNYQL
jgi:hypothetical protein